MTFGSDKTFALIGDALEKCDETAYDPVCKILYEDIGVLIHKYCRDVCSAAQDWEDILQILVYKVLTRLPEFYLKSGQLSEQSRNAWLKTVVMNERNSIYRKMKKPVEVEYQDAFRSASEPDTAQKAEKREELLEAIQHVFQLPTSPDKLIAFVYSQLFHVLSGVNGSPRTVLEKFEGMALSDMYQEMVSDFSDILQYQVPRQVLEPLANKVAACPDMKFSLSAHQITDSGYRIRKKIKEQYKNGT